LPVDDPWRDQPAVAFIADIQRVCVLTGRVNGDDTVNLYVITSTISANGDQGADPNKLATATDRLNATSLPPSDSDGWGHFTTLRAAQAGEVLCGISFAPAE
jgi:hypothetical protein